MSAEITAAVQAEREACARLLEDAAEDAETRATRWRNNGATDMEEKKAWEARCLREQALQIRARTDGSQSVMTPEHAFVEKELRLRLWMGHGHQGMYGDDGEMQCAECLRFGPYDYKRAPIRELLATVQAVGLFKLAEAQQAERERNLPLAK